MEGLRPAEFGLLEELKEDPWGGSTMNHLSVK